MGTFVVPNGGGSYPRDRTYLRGHFSFDLAKGRRDKHPTIPFVLAELRKNIGFAARTHTYEHSEPGKPPRKSHRRPSGLELSSQSWGAYNIRFVLAGDIWSAWDTFGCLAAQVAHFGTVLNLDVDENATTTQTCDNILRDHAGELSKFRQKEHEITKLLIEEGRWIKREVLRDFNAATEFAPKKKHHPKKGKKAIGRITSGSPMAQRGIE